MASQESLIRLFDETNHEIVACRLCPRLVEWRERVAREKRKAFMDQEYWGKAVPMFGDPLAKRLILGLAPAAHGANRTGRMFTGDRSGDWLFRALYKAGVANQPTAVSRDDGLELRGAMMVASCFCAPPDNKPLPSEIENCSRYSSRMIASRPWKAVLCLGSIGWGRAFKMFGEREGKFGHGAVVRLASGTRIVGSYHPSQQNTFTGRLTETMLDDAIALWLRDD